ncbi:hypothetical protein KDK88_05780 [bacterium]|nr:hypothetical protein [bacterium]HPF36727.1 hypothetical protein [Candidatus Krumholzibacteria bacterium]HRX52692.1 hypothetical protein [Candidatus Krumholzibacteria bacterium]
MNARPLRRAARRAALVLTILALLAGSAAADFRSTRTGARPRAMGSAFVSISDDANAVHWNPAGLTAVDDLQAMVTHNRLYGVADELRDDALTLSGPRFRLLGLDVRAAGAFVRRAIPDVYYEDTYELSLAAEAPGLRGLSCGVTGKVFRLSAPGYEQYNDPAYLGADTGLAADVGLIYRAEDPWSLGAVLYNLNEPHLQLLGTTTNPDPVHRAFAVGGSYLFRDTLVLTGDVRSARFHFDELRINAGAEIWFFDTLALRSGLYEGNVTMGLGLQDRSWRADFALETHEEVGDAYILSFTLRK